MNPGKGCSCLVWLVLLVLAGLVLLPAITGKSILHLPAKVSALAPPTPTPNVVPGYVSEEAFKYALDANERTARDGFIAVTVLGVSYGLSSAASNFLLGAVILVGGLALMFIMLGRNNHGR